MLKIFMYRRDEHLEHLDHFRTVAVLLSLPVEWMRECDVCGEPRRFVAEAQRLNGLLGECLGCGTRSVAFFTRAISEAV